MVISQLLGNNVKEDISMGNFFRYFIMAGAVLFLTSCVEENFEQVKPAQSGDEVVFNAVSGVEIDAPKTRTVYSGATYTVNNKVYERIEWTNGDKVKIYCHTANNKQAANYSVTPGANSTTQTHTASLNKHESNDGIQWNGTGEHTFYAIYPSPDMPDAPDSKTTLEGKVDLTYDEETSTATLTGYVPTTQAPIGFEDAKEFSLDGTVTRTATKWAKPDMRYTYMVACNKAKPSDGGVNLSFSAISTVMEIDITAPEATTISEVIIQSKSGKALTGNFTCNINSDGTPDTESVEITNGASTLNIQLGSVDLKANGTLRITALLLPIDFVANDLNIIVQTNSLMRGTLKNVSLSAHKKHYLTNVSLKQNVKGNNWVSLLPDNVLLRGLSIPATSNSFSYYLASNDINQSYTGTLSDEQNRYITQTKSFNDQWDMGIRCFEFVCDRNSSTASSTSLGGQTLMCNGQGLGITFKAAFDEVANKLKQTIDGGEGVSDEFAMIICTYQPNGDTDNARNPEAYMTQLKNFYDVEKANNVNLVLYKPGIDVDSVRGSIMLVARPSQEGEDSDSVVESAVAGNEYNILTVKGWGSLPDKWWRRGYEAALFKGAGTSGEIKDQREIAAQLPAIEDWIYGTSYSQGAVSPYYPYATGTKNDINTNFPANNGIRFNYSTDAQFEVWAQEWRRIVKEDVTITGTVPTFWLFGTRYESYEYTFFESLDEKKNCIETTFETSIKDISNSYVYFNSLSGYYILTDNSEDSYRSFGPYWMGNLGNIGDYSTHINNWFDGIIEQKGEANITGPMGIVIMDRVGETQASTDLARIIIANNFKFELPTL